MEITTTQIEGTTAITILRVNGKVNTTEPLFSAAKKAHDAGTRRMVIDLTNVPYISSAGLKAIHDIYNLLRTGTEFEHLDKPALMPFLKLANPSELVSDILKLMAFDIHIEVHPDVPSAVEAF